MKRLLTSLLFVFLLVSCKKDLPEKYDTTNHVYTLDVVLNEDTNTLHVNGELSYYNEIPNLTELYLHVYPNAINPTNQPNNVVFEQLRVNNQAVTVSFSGEDNTLLHVDLEDPVARQERISITFDYSFSYWNVDRINAIDDSYYMTMFFYPFVPVYDENGWNIEPYSFRGESYYNTVGDYYVTLDVPLDYEVAASGEVIHTAETANRRTIDYQILDARDFSFSASSAYNVYSRIWNNRQYDIYALNDLTPSEQNLYFEYLATSFAVFERDFGPYPYDHFTLELGYIYGMESTGVVYCSMDVQEGTVVHEVAHQWFYSIIGNDQADEPFLDEALVSYITSYYFLEIHGTDGYNGYLDFRNSLKPEAEEYFNTYQGTDILLHLLDYDEGYAYQVYYHGPTIYRYYVEYFLDGDTTRFKQALADYYNIYKYEEATIDQLFHLLEDTLNEPGTVDWLYEQAHDLQDLEQENPN